MMIPSTPIPPVHCHLQLISFWYLPEAFNNTLAFKFFFGPADRLGECGWAQPPVMGAILIWPPPGWPAHATPLQGRGSVKFTAGGNPASGATNLALGSIARKNLSPFRGLGDA